MKVKIHHSGTCSSRSESQVKQEQGQHRDGAASNCKEEEIGNTVESTGTYNPGPSSACTASRGVQQLEHQRPDFSSQLSHGAAPWPQACPFASLCLFPLPTCTDHVLLGAGTFVFSEFAKCILGKGLEDPQPLCQELETTKKGHISINREISPAPHSALRCDSLCTVPVLSQAHIDQRQTNYPSA